MKRNKVRLIVWNAAEAGEKADIVRQLGYRVDYGPFDQAALRKMRSAPPDAVIIDLRRIPSQGRDVGLGVRSSKGTRGVPIVFIEGDPEKTAKVREHLPDAVFSTWETIDQDLKQAIENPPSSPVVPRSNLAGYEGAPLPKKLGIKPDIDIVLVHAPETFEQKLGPLPEGAAMLRLPEESLRVVGKKSKPGGLGKSSPEKKAAESYPRKLSAMEQAGLNRSSAADQAGRRTLILWFVRAKEELGSMIRAMAAGLGDGGVWIIWPKRSSGVSSDLTQNIVRAAGLAAGLVDYKVCSVDETWSGLLFSRRK
jgi:hypothetical protein